MRNSPVRRSSRRRSTRRKLRQHPNQTVDDQRLERIARHLHISLPKARRHTRELAALHGIGTTSAVIMQLALIRKGDLKLE